MLYKINFSLLILLRIKKNLPEAVAPKAINKDEHGILVSSSFKSSRQMIENGNLNIHICSTCLFVVH
jgi:hypothetical protein